MDGFPNVPNEIIVEIFSLCLPESSHCPSTDPRVSPILLTHVCSSWRRFAQHTPRLWQDLNLSTESSSDLLLTEAEDKARQLTRQVELWSINTQGMPLDITLRLVSPYASRRMPEDGSVSEPPDGRFYSLEFWHPLVIVAICDHGKTLRKLCLDMDGIDHGIPLYQLPSNHFPVLQSLRLTTKGNPLSHFDQRISVFSQAPSLRKVVLDLNIPQMISTDLPLGQLTHLIIIKGHSAKFFRSILEECSVLEELSMGIYDHHSEHQISVTAHSLRKLYVTMMKRVTISFFDNVNLPALQDFGIYSDTGQMPPTFQWDSNTPSYGHLLNQLHCLHTLKLGYQVISSDNLLDILRSTPYLVELAVDADLESYIAFLNGLTYNPNSSSNIVPRLEVFSLYVEIHRIERDLSTYPFKPADFMATILSRAPSSLRKVFLCTERTSFTHALDIDVVAEEFRNQPELRDMEFIYEITEGDDKLDWLREKIEAW